VRNQAEGDEQVACAYMKRTEVEDAFSIHFLAEACRKKTLTSLLKISIVTLIDFHRFRKISKKKSGKVLEEDRHTLTETGFIRYSLDETGFNRQNFGEEYFLFRFIR